METAPMQCVFVLDPKLWSSAGMVFFMRLSNLCL